MRLVIDIKDQTHAAIKKAATKEKKGIKSYILWRLGMTATERGNEKCSK